MTVGSVKSVQIANSDLLVSIVLNGGEVRSVKNSQTEHEYMWSGDAAIWPGVSPVLFPVVGRTTNNQIKFQGHSYPLGNHGFARHSVFKLVEQSAHSVTLSLSTADLAPGTYPFRLELQLTYTLRANTLQTIYRVINHDSQQAYFSVGAHPAFKCPFDAKHSIEDYHLEFSQTENLQQHFLEGAFMSGKRSLTTQQVLQLSAETFANDAIVYSGYSSPHISLVEKDSSRKIRVSLTNFPFLGLWSKPGADYLCIEPWCGHSDGLDFAAEVDQKAAILILAAGEVWLNSYDIEFGY